MTWEILAALIVIVACLVSLGTVLAKLVAVLSRLETTMKIIANDVSDHETRIRTLEKGDDRRA